MFRFSFGCRSGENINNERAQLIKYVARCGKALQECPKEICQDRLVDAAGGLVEIARCAQPVGEISEGLIMVVVIRTRMTDLKD